MLVLAPYNGVTIKNGTVRGFSFGVTLNGSNHNMVKNLTLTENLIGVEVGTGQRDVLRTLRLDQNRDVRARLFTADHNAVLFNRVTGGRWGFILQVDADANWIAGNRVSGDATSTDRGIQVGIDSDNNVLTGNRVRDDGQYGISVTENSSGTIVTLNRVESSGIHGVYVDPSATDTVLKWNRSSVNAVDDIHIDDGAVNTRIARNTANDNGDWGISALAPVVDGGRNRARGNGQPDQCLGLVCR